MSEFAQDHDQKTRLLAEIRAAEAELARLRTALDYANGLVRMERAWRKEAQAELEAARRVVTAAREWKMTVELIRAMNAYDEAVKRGDGDVFRENNNSNCAASREVDGDNVR